MTFPTLQKSLPGNVNQAKQSINNVMKSLNNKKFRGPLKEEMEKKLKNNGKNFYAWLEKTGIHSKSPLAKDYLRAQAFFAVQRANGE